MAKRIAFLTTQFSEVKSGPGRFAQYLHNLDIPELEFSFFSEQISKNQGNEVCVSIPSFVKKLPFSWFFKAWYYSKVLKKLDRKEPFDWILSSDYSLSIFADSGICDRLFTMVNDDNYLLIFQPGEHQRGMSAGRKWARRLGYFFEKAVVRKSRFVVSNSLYTKGLVEKIYQIPESKSVLLYKAVDLSYFQFKEQGPNPPRRFLFVKNDWKRGGLDLIFSALAQLPFQQEVHFTIAGISENQKETVYQIAQSSGYTGKYEIRGLLNKEQLANVFHSSDLFLSMSRQEALGVSCLEAMASGLPVLASDAGGLPEVLNFGQTGFLVRRNDVNHLVETLLKIEEQPVLASEKSHNAIRHVEKFSLIRLQSNLNHLFGDSSPQL
ncbi:MAG TPA: glycosyltransferase family 4 protein [Catalimonadaceae bacterium]|nr:glycosyltransferase family 4 protein [Catalimonadaceae bacterium]